MDADVATLARMFATARYPIFMQTISHILGHLQSAAQAGLEDPTNIENGRLKFSVNPERILGTDLFNHLISSSDIKESRRFKNAISRVSKGDTSVYEEYNIDTTKINVAPFDFADITSIGAMRYDSIIFPAAVLSSSVFSAAILRSSFKGFVKVVIFYFMRHDSLKRVFRQYGGTNALGDPDYEAVIRQFAKIIKINVPEVDDDERQDAAVVLCLLCSSLGSDDDLAPAAEVMANDGRDFENRCRVILEESGFDVRTTPIIGDYGADLIAEKEGLTYAVQCKSGTTPAGTKAVQEAIAGRDYYVTDFAVVVAEAGFTHSAKELAGRGNVLLVKEKGLMAIDVMVSNL